MAQTSPASKSGAGSQPARPRWNTAGYFLTNLALGLIVAALGPSLPFLAEQTHSKLPAMGLLFTVRSVGYLAAVLGLGRIFDLFPGNRLLSGMVLMTALMMALVPVTPNLWFLMAVMFAIGIGEMFFDIGSNTLLVWIHQERSGPYLNAMHFFFGVGACLAPLLTGQAVARTGRIDWGYWIMALSMVPLVLFFLSLPSPRPEPVSTNDGAEAPRLGEVSRLVFWVAVFYFFYAGAEGGFGGWIFSYAVETQLADEAGASYLTSTFWIAFTVGRFAGIPLAARWRPRTILLLDLAGSFLSVAALRIFDGSPTMLWVGSAGLGLFLASIFPTVLAWAARRLVVSSRVTRWFFLGVGCGGMTFPWLIGQLFSRFRPVAMLDFLLIDLLVLGGLFGLLMRQAPHPVRGEVT